MHFISMWLYSRIHSILKISTALYFENTLKYLIRLVDNIIMNKIVQKKHGCDQLPCIATNCSFSINCVVVIFTILCFNEPTQLYSTFNCQYMVYALAIGWSNSYILVMLHLSSGSPPSTSQWSLFIFCRNLKTRLHNKCLRHWLLYPVCNGIHQFILIVRYGVTTWVIIKNNNNSNNGNK